MLVIFNFVLWLMLFNNYFAFCYLGHKIYTTMYSRVITPLGFSRSANWRKLREIRERTSLGVIPSSSSSISTGSGNYFIFPEGNLYVRINRYVSLIPRISRGWCSIIMILTMKTRDVRTMITYSKEKVFVVCFQLAIDSVRGS